MGTLLWWSCQSPVAYSCGLLNHANSFCEGMFKLNAKLDADLLLYSLSHFECEATQYTCSLNSIYCPLLTSTVKSSLFMMYIPVHSSSLSVYINVVQTILIINNAWTFSGHTLCVCVYMRFVQKISSTYNIYDNISTFQGTWMNETTSGCQDNWSIDGYTRGRRQLRSYKIEMKNWEIYFLNIKCRLPIMAVKESRPHIKKKIKGAEGPRDW